MSKLKRRGLAGAVSTSEMRDRLERARLAFGALQRTSKDEGARELEVDLARQIRCLEGDLMQRTLTGSGLTSGRS